jgi:hypothetical protein
MKTSNVATMKFAVCTPPERLISSLFRLSVNVWLLCSASVANWLFHLILRLPIQLFLLILIYMLRLATVYLPISSYDLFNYLCSYCISISQMLCIPSSVLTTSSCFHHIVRPFSGTTLRLPSLLISVFSFCCHVTRMGLPLPCKTSACFSYELLYVECISNFHRNICVYLICLQHLCFSCTTPRLNHTLSRCPVP